jgi:protein associated with RNAse G/E
MLESMHGGVGFRTRLRRIGKSHISGTGSGASFREHNQTLAPAYHEVQGVPPAALAGRTVVRRSVTGHADTVTAMHSVRVVYRKYDDGLHWHQWMRYLGEDQYGLWLGAPPNSVAQRGDEPEIVHPHAHVMLLPRDDWWTASFNDEPGTTEIYCDITTPVDVSGELVTMIDLDLDVVKRRDGTVYVDDEDEFAEHQLKYGYPTEVITAAQASCDRLMTAVVTEEPFLSAYKSYLDLVR